MIKWTIIVLVLIAIIYFGFIKNYVANNEDSAQVGKGYQILLGKITK